jgi:CRISPR-associated endonuclease/helicase Cas3
MVTPPDSQDSKPQSHEYFAHSANGHGDWHRLADHLASVSRMAKEFLQGWNGAEEAALAGLLHDLGKYGDRFQARLHGKDKGLDHWSQGASLALRLRAVAAALAIEGHHIGLQRGSIDSLRRLLPDNLPAAVLPGLALSEPNVERLQSLAAKDGIEFTTPASFALNSWAQTVAAMLDVRLLFSCLVDADFLDTEAHFEGDAQGKRPRPEGPKLDASAALTALDAHMAALRADTNAQVAVQQARETLWSAVIRAGQAGTWHVHADRADRFRQDAGDAQVRAGTREEAWTETDRSGSPFLDSHRTDGAYLPDGIQPKAGSMSPRLSISSRDGWSGGP